MTLDHNIQASFIGQIPTVVHVDLGTDATLVMLQMLTQWLPSEGLFDMSGLKGNSHHFLQTPNI